MFETLRRKLFGGENTVSKARAMSRLHFVLVQDRTGLTPAEMVTFKSELMAVLEKYFVVDKQGFDVAYKRETDSTTLLINSPILVRRQNPTAKNDNDKSKAKGKTDKDAKEVKEAPKDSSKDSKDKKDNQKDKVKELSKETVKEKDTSEEKEEVANS